MKSSAGSRVEFQMKDDKNLKKLSITYFDINSFHLFNIRKDMMTQRIMEEVNLVER